MIVTVCRLFRSKGPGDLVDALPGVHKEHPDARLVVVGGEMEPGFLAELQHLARDLGVERHVSFTGRRNDVPRLMAAADVYAMPSLYEPFGLVYLEAMAMELPVVALNSGGTPEVVVHGETGLLSDPGDLDALTAHLVRLLDDPDERARMGERGRRLVEERFTIRRMADDVAAVYARVAA